MEPRYRIVRDRYSGYEVQVWRWWCLRWVQAGGTNTHNTVEDAERFAESCEKKRLRKRHAGNVVKYLGGISPRESDQ